MITTLDHNLGDVQVTMVREQVCGVDVVMERHQRRNAAAVEVWYVDPVRLLHLKERERALLKRSHRSLAGVREMIERNLHLMKN